MLNTFSGEKVPMDTREKRLSGQITPLAKKLSGLLWHATETDICYAMRTPEAIFGTKWRLGTRKGTYWACNRIEIADFRRSTTRHGFCGAR